MGITDRTTRVLAMRILRCLSIIGSVYHPVLPKPRCLIVYSKKFVRQVSQVNSLQKETQRASASAYLVVVLSGSCSNRDGSIHSNPCNGPESFARMTVNV